MFYLSCYQLLYSWILEKGEMVKILLTFSVVLQVEYLGKFEFVGDCFVIRDAWHNID